MGENTEPKTFHVVITVTKEIMTQLDIIANTAEEAEQIALNFDEDKNTDPNVTITGGIEGNWEVEIEIGD